MKNKKNITPFLFVLHELVNGRHITQEFLLKETGYWRLASIIDAIQRKYQIKISRQNVVAKKAKYQVAYWLDEEARRKILDAQNKKRGTKK